METKYFVDAEGRYIGGFSGYLDDTGQEVYPEFPAGGIEVPAAPADARQKWDGEKWLAYEE